MNYIKVVLLIQAIVILIIGAVFLSQVIFKESQNSFNFSNLENTSEFTKEKTQEKIKDLEKRFLLASFILIIIGLIELLIVSRLIS